MRRLRRLLSGPRDRGIALPIVIALGAVMMTLIATGLTTSLSGLKQAGTDQNATGAYDAAFAGVQDYVAHLNADATYSGYGNTGATFSAGSAVTPPANTNPAFGIGAGGTWATVPVGAANSSVCPGTGVPCFRYEVDNRTLAAAGIVRVRSTGRVGQTTRSIVTTIKRQGFVNFLYYTDYETQDPAVSGTPACAVYAWAASRPSSCTIQFAATDTLAGPVHSNDTLAVCGTTFKQIVTTANPNNVNVATPSGCSGGHYAVGTGPKSVSKIDMPSTNTAMRAQARSDLVTSTGCLYTGPTVVKYLGTGQMTVWSPWSKYTNITSSTSTGSNPDKCGAPGTQTNQLGSAGGATVNELNMNLLYVQTVPGAPDPNYSPTTSIPSGMTCVGSDGRSTVTDAASSVGWKFGPWSFPTTNEAAPDGWDSNAGINSWSGSGSWSTSLPAYNCRNGDLYVKGQVTTQTTAASDNYVYVIGDLTLQDLSQDVLGLVGNNAVLVWNPVDANKASLIGDSGREIDAAILSVAHTFQVQNFNISPPRGSLKVVGSIAQKFRGPVATSSGTSVATGYAKNYQYDALLGSVTPPYFLAPSSTVFQPKLYANVPAAFLPSGAVK